MVCVVFLIVECNVTVLVKYHRRIARFSCADLIFTPTFLEIRRLVIVGLVFQNLIIDSDILTTAAHGSGLQEDVQSLTVAHTLGWHEQYFGIAGCSVGLSAGIASTRLCHRSPITCGLVCIGEREDVEITACTTLRTATQQNIAVGQLFHLAFVAAGGGLGDNTAKVVPCITEVIGIDHTTSVRARVHSGIHTVIIANLHLGALNHAARGEEKVADVRGVLIQLTGDIGLVPTASIGGAECATNQGIQSVTEKAVSSRSGYDHDFARLTVDDGGRIAVGVAEATVGSVGDAVVTDHHIENVRTPCCSIVRRGLAKQIDGICGVISLSQVCSVVVAGIGDGQERTVVEPRNGGNAGIGLPRLECGRIAEYCHLGLRRRRRERHDGEEAGG